MATFTCFKGIPPKKVIRTALGNKKPKCIDCRYYSEGKCTLFISLNKDYQIINANIEMIRARETLCGPDGKLFKPK